MMVFTFHAKNYKSIIISDVFQEIIVDELRCFCYLEDCTTDPVSIFG